MNSKERSIRHRYFEMKNGRQKQILTIVSEHDVETQEELIVRLKASGFKATQATVSRDIKELRLIKMATENGHYKYVQSVGEDGKSSAKFDNVLRETVISVRNAGPIVVVRTYAGMAMAAWPLLWTPCRSTAFWEPLPETIPFSSPFPTRLPAT